MLLKKSQISNLFLVILYNILLIFIFHGDILEKIKLSKREISMTIEKIKTLLRADVLYGLDFLDREVQYAFSSDMMSDVLAFASEESALITGLCNAQVVRTAEMLDIVCIIFVRNKIPDQTILALAQDKEIVILCTEHGMFNSCGILYSNGLPGGAFNQ